MGYIVTVLYVVMTQGVAMHLQLIPASYNRQPFQPLPLDESIMQTNPEIRRKAAGY